MGRATPLYLLSISPSSSFSPKHAQFMAKQPTKKKRFWKHFKVNVRWQYNRHCYWHVWSKLWLATSKESRDSVWTCRMFKLKLILQADWTIHKTKLKGLGCSKEYCSATYWLKRISQRFIIGAVRFIKQSRTCHFVELTLSFLCADYWRDRACK